MNTYGICNTFPLLCGTDPSNRSIPYREGVKCSVGITYEDIYDVNGFRFSVYFDYLSDVLYPASYVKSQQDKSYPCTHDYYRKYCMYWNSDWVATWDKIEKKGIVVSIEAPNKKRRK